MRRGVSAKRFWAYHISNPQIWKYFFKFSCEALARGREHFSAKYVYNKIRWDTDVTTAPDEYKLCDQYHAWYGHLFNLLYREGFYRERGQKDFAPVLEAIRAYPWEGYKGYTGAPPSSTPPVRTPVLRTPVVAP